MYSSKYTTSWAKRIAFILLVALAIGAGWWIGTSECRASEEKMLQCWALCKPGEGNQVWVRSSPHKGNNIDGWVEVGDSFYTDGKNSNGFLHVYGAGDAGEGWIYSGYVSTEEPVEVNEQYVCVALKRVACRRWIHGPQVENYGWLTNGSNVFVYWMTSEWAITSKGFIQSEWLEVDPL